MPWTTKWHDKFASVGKEVLIDETVLFTAPELCHLGNHVRIDAHTVVTVGLHTGDFVQITAFAMLGGGRDQKIYMGDWSYIGYHSRLFTATESYDDLVNEYWHHDQTNVRRGDIVFGDFAGVASNVTMLNGITLPPGCRIGADSFVHPKKGPYKPWSLYVGRPAEFVRYIDSEKVLAQAEIAESRPR